MAYLCHIGPKIGVKKTENLYKKVKESVVFLKKIYLLLGMILSNN